jgi:hypothetical protein
VASAAKDEDKDEDRDDKDRRFLASTLTTNSRIHPWYLIIYYLHQSSYAETTTYTYPISIILSITQRRRWETETEHKWLCSI